MRRALDDIADAQSEVLDALEDQAAGGEADDVLDDDAPPDDPSGLSGIIEDEEPEDEPEPEGAPVAEPLHGAREPEIVEPPPAEALAGRKPRRPRVIDLPSSEAA